MSFNSKYLVLPAMLVTAALVGCSDSEPTEPLSQVDQPAQQNTMDVKEQKAQTEFKPLVEMPAKPAEPAAAVEQTAPPVAKDETVEIVVEQVEEIKPAKTVAAVKEDAAVTVAAANGAGLYATCIGCHGAAGEGGMGPKLAGQSIDALVTKLNLYKSGEQVGPMTAVMAPMAQPLSDAEILALAEHVQTFE